MSWVILSKPDCPYCVKAKELLNVHKKEFVEFDITKDTVFRAFLKCQDLHTVPQVYYLGTRIGGYEDLEEFLRDGNGVSADG